MRKNKKQGKVWLTKLSGILDLIYPVRCPFCDRPVPYRQGQICPDCEPEKNIVRQPYCMKCGKQLRREEQEFCEDCLLHTHYFERGRILFVYKGAIKKSVYRFKYGGRKEYAKIYAGLVERELGDFVKEINPDGIIPVPLHRRRHQKRGYNQAELLAGEIGDRMRIPVYAGFVSRVKNTIPQKKLDLAGRQNNLKKAFKICRNDVKLNTIIIIDDIYTTGSTIDAMSCLLRQYGVKRIFFLALAGGEQ